jgi:hypothetical protein
MTWISDLRWIVALDCANERGDIGPLLELLARSPAPDWVREELTELGKRRLSVPRRRHDYTDLKAAAHAVKMKWGQRPGETVLAFEARVAKDYGVTRQALRSFRERRTRLSRDLRDD